MESPSKTEQKYVISQELADKYGLSYGLQDKMLMETKWQNREIDKKLMDPSLVKSTKIDVATKSEAQ